MSNQNRPYAELAGVFLMWVEEVPDQRPQWAAHVMRRTLNSDVSLFGARRQVFPQVFIESSEAEAKRTAENAVCNSPDPEVRAYAHRIAGELKWKKWEGSEQAWGDLWNRFTEGEEIR